MIDYKNVTADSVKGAILFETFKKLVFDAILDKYDNFYDWRKQAAICLSLIDNADELHFFKENSPQIPWFPQDVVAEDFKKAVMKICEVIGEIRFDYGSDND